jgi:hypothetical protein
MEPGTERPQKLRVAGVTYGFAARECASGELQPNDGEELGKNDERDADDEASLNPTDG